MKIHAAYYEKNISFCRGIVGAKTTDRWRKVTCKRCLALKGTAYDDLPWVKIRPIPVYKIFSPTEEYFHDAHTKPASYAEVIKRALSILIDIGWDWPDIAYFTNNVFGKTFGEAYKILKTQRRDYGLAKP